MILRLGGCCIAAVAVAGALTVGTPSYATTFSDHVYDYTDTFDTTETYFGAVTPGGFTDVVSNVPTTTSSQFEIKKAEATLDYTGSATKLTIDIYTNYAAGILGTTLGDLLLTPEGSYDPKGTGPNFSIDQLSNTNTVWKYALVLGDAFSTKGDGQSIAAGSSTGAELYSLGSNASIQTSYDGSIVCPSGNFRCGQPVEYKGGVGDADTGLSGSLDVSSSSTLASATGLYMLEFVIDDISSLTALGNDATGYNIAFSWAMTCANDVIQGVLHFPGNPGGENPVPLPAAFPLFAFALGGMGVAGRWRRHRSRG